ncbi:hypothetical protein UY3_04026 [Chelonia mydas]|uniref:Myb/SANT-like DNA-binding domain-containing protein n=1 Tax=Chelonia mydas TaxID=8469 RepID=M7CD65_CHEMY|nr:hypothetical protein UY3_04026 [Chelonia mydas]
MQSQNCKRAPAWTERGVLDLIGVWGDESMLSELRSKRQNANTFAKISKGMIDRGYNRDPQQCHMKIKELSCKCFHAPPVISVPEASTDKKVKKMHSQ